MDQSSASLYLDAQAHNYHELPASFGHLQVSSNVYPAAEDFGTSGWALLVVFAYASVDTFFWLSGSAQEFRRESQRLPIAAKCISGFQSRTSR